MTVMLTSMGAEVGVWGWWWHPARSSTGATTTFRGVQFWLFAHH